MRKFKSIALVSILAALAIACGKKEKPEGEKAASTPAAAKVEASAKVASVARAHLPEGCEVVAIVDWQKFRELKSIKQNLETELGKLDKPKDGKPVTDKDVQEVIDFLQKADIDLRADPSELAACVTGVQKAKADQTPTFVGIIGGKFRPGAAMDVFDSVTERLKGLMRRAAATGDAKKSEPEIIEIAGQKVVHDKAENVYFGQAKDGAFVFGNDRAQFEKALSASKAHEGYKLSAETIGVTLTKAMAPLLSEAMAGSPFVEATKTFTGATLGVSEKHVVVELSLEDEKQLAELKTQLEQLVKQLAGQPGNPFGPVLASAKLSVAGKVLTVDVPVPEEAVNGLLQQVGGPVGGPPVGAAPAGPAR